MQCISDIYINVNLCWLVLKVDIIVKNNHLYAFKFIVDKYFSTLREKKTNRMNGFPVAFKLDYSKTCT